MDSDSESVKISDIIWGFWFDFEYDFAFNINLIMESVATMNDTQQLSQVTSANAGANSKIDKLTIQFS